MLGSGWLGQVQVLFEYSIRTRRGFGCGATEGGSLCSLIGSREGRPRKSAEGLCPSDPGARCTELLFLIRLCQVHLEVSGSQVQLDSKEEKI